ncbi:M13 family metallopeptidase [Hephaestia sp. GCM10023244]|uniref:M13 family metallopeptidase n=1 Tax=unclassified Hephaestia TaxID=2631281 RepID=UPI0020772EFC|nr:M13 family metallopeptidase [Hephaestia sp. MAHUQ-44]MCM8732123.1 M13 family metallopeptidase [Hephaestia sp. MAHUQ-44]
MTRRLLLAALLVTTAACSQADKQNDIAAVAAAGTTIGIDTTGLNTAVNPGDNFDEYANGGWRAKTEIPADRSSTGVFLEVANKAEANNRAIIDAAVKAEAAPGTDQRRIADFYNAYLNTNAIEQRGMAPLQGELRAIAALGDKHQLATMLGANLLADQDPINATSIGSENLFGLFVTQALTQPDKTVPYLLQGGLGMPDRDYYLSSAPEMQQIRTAYKSYVAQLLQLAGVSDAPARAGRIVDLETKLAKVHADLATTNQMSKGHDPWTRADFAKKAPGLDWGAFWAAAELPNQQDFIVWQPAAVTGTAALVASEPLQAWQDWLTFHRINTVTSVLPKAIDDAHFGFYGTTMSGTPEQRSRDKRAVGAVNNALGDAVGKLYAAQYFPASSKADIQHMVQGILTAFDTRVANLTWMAPATKAEARKKIETLKVGIGYPETWRDYAGLEIRADDPVGNARRAAKAEYRHQIAKIGKPVDRGEWWMTPQTVNAVNLPLQNALNFPAAILQAPFYDPKADPAANYGAIGAVIGHEISHSFDNNGAEFDSTGKLRNWWTPADLKHFQEQGAALAAQYSAYEPLPGLHLNGELVLGENIADVAGLTAALAAYHASLGGKPAPVIAGMTGDQRFFLAFAQVWRTKMREQALRQQIATNGHAPGAFRALTVRNLDDWYTAFDVQPGRKLYLAPDKRVRVW